ncbi:phosphopantetheine-binding protein [Streptomyces sp. LP05-1]|uniref:Phosphopantetheine-binding protein n=1 Tax=Streptomyces pyxinae TaxID=2970734 RepID=A0ABT2CJI6_9ACTN|nr:phosphopantetheine-binding protein [Streptomyces sp. LP05-1]MCS0637586.1 phosphopantetheine-binding protein [Streptomyces sp. LP05-1]
MPEPLTQAAFRADLAEVLHQRPDDVDLDENPLYAGLDSLRIAALAERWRDAGAEVSFVELAERTSFAQWWQLLAERLAGAPRAGA